MKNRFKCIMKVGFVFACILSLICIPCHHAFAAYEPAKTPKIKSFTASSTNVSMGENVLLEWNVVNATEIRIEGLMDLLEEELPMKGSIEIVAKADITYTLVASGSTGTVKQSITINVGTGGNNEDNVSIDYFNASRTEIVMGETFELSWETTNAKSITIVGIEKGTEELLPLKGSLEVYPTDTTTYTLKAVGRNGEIVHKSLTVKVEKQSGGPKVNSFTASESTVSKGELVTLRWNTTNATGCKLVTSDGFTLINRPVNGSISVTPNQTKSYTLIAYNANGDTDKKTITITIK